jgi:hypothetical protein
MDLVSDIGDNRAIGGGYVGALPASFAAQMAEGLGGFRQSKANKDEQERFTKIMMARMNSLEEGFREVIHEMRDHMRRDDSRSRSPAPVARPVARARKFKQQEMQRPTSKAGNKENVEPEEAPHADETVSYPQSGGDVETGDQERFSGNDLDQRPASR